MRGGGEQRTESGRVEPRYHREIAGLALPALGALAADPLVTMVDTLFVGRLGVVPLGALGVNASVFALAFVAFNFLAYGTTPRVAREVGRGNRTEAGRLAVEALVLAVILGVASAALLMLLAGPILRIMGAGGELFDPALAYLRIRALSGPAVLLVLAGHGIFRGYQDTRTPLYVTLALNGVNLVLDPLFIFGFGWGLQGAAWATVAAQWTGALIFLHLLLRSRRAEMGLPLALPLPRDLLPFLRIGGELAVRTVALVATMTLATAVATRVGTESVAAHQVAMQIWLFLALVVDALAVAGQALVGRYRGEGGRPLARAVAHRLLAWGLAVGLALALLVHFLSPWIPGLFTGDPTTAALVGGVLPFVAALQPLNALVFVWDGIFLGAEDFRYLAFQMLVSAAAAVLILLLVLPSGWGLVGVWWGITVLMGARGVTLALRYRRVP